MFRSEGGSAEGGAYGVVVPEGDPGALHDAAAALTSVAGVLEHVGGELAKGTPADWHGSAAMNFSNACATEGGVATRGAGAMDVAAHALHGLARDLAEAQKACRHQVGLAREAKQRGDRARLAAERASQQASAARMSAAASAKRASMAELASLPSGPERAAQAASNDTATAADIEFRIQTKAAGVADEHLQDARVTAKRKLERYEASARHTAGILSGLAAQAPTVAAVNGHPVAATGGPGRPPGIVPIAVKPPQPAKQDDDGGGGILGALKDVGHAASKAYHGVSTVGHAALDVVGVIPVAGDVLADGTNALWYAAERDWTNAAISGGAMVPVAGTAATAGKWTKRGIAAAKEAEKVADAAKGTEKAAGAANAATKTVPVKRWKVGDDINAPTKNGPAKWDVIRKRYWKNEAANPQSTAYDATPENISRMKKGLAPQQYNPERGEMESLELSHEPIPQRDGGKDVVPRWPEEHAAIDEHRHLKSRK